MTLIDVTESTFAGRTMDLDGHSFVRCTFDGCHLRYSGGFYQLSGCTFERCQFVFYGAAERMLEFLQEMASSPGGAAIVQPLIFSRGVQAPTPRSQMH